MYLNFSKVCILKKQFRILEYTRLQLCQIMPNYFQNWLYQCIKQLAVYENLCGSTQRPGEAVTAHARQAPSPRSVRIAPTPKTNARGQMWSWHLFLQRKDKPMASDPV